MYIGFHPSLQVKERPDIGVYVKGLSSFIVKSPNEMEKLMAKGNKSRKRCLHVRVCNTQPQYSH